MDALLIALRDAAVNDLARQARGRDGFQPPTRQLPDSVSYFDGGFQVTPVVLAVLRDLRKLPETRIAKAIDTVLAAPSKG